MIVFAEDAILNLDVTSSNMAPYKTIYNIQEHSIKMIIWTWPLYNSVTHIYNIATLLWISFTDWVYIYPKSEPVTETNQKSLFSRAEIPQEAHFEIQHH